MRLDELAEQALADGNITADEAEILIKAEASRLRSINVDDFAAHKLASQPQETATPARREKTQAA